MEHAYQPTFNPLQNLKGFIVGRPPLLVFLICLITIAVTGLSLAYFVRTSEIKNPDIQHDWNTLFEKLSKLSFCTEHNKTNEKPLVAFDVRDMRREFSSIEVNTEPVAPHSDEMRNNSISIIVNLKFGSEIKKISDKVSTISGLVCGGSLGLTGVYEKKEIRVTLSLPEDRRLVECDNSNFCSTTSQSVCVTFFGLPPLPNTQKMKKCIPTKFLNSTFSVPKCNDNELEDGTFELFCQGNIIKLIYSSNPDWSVMLSEHDRALINFHLMYTSYFLLLMVMTLLCYAIIRGRPKNKVVLLEKVSFDS